MPQYSLANNVLGRAHCNGMRAPKDGYPLREIESAEKSNLNAANIPPSASITAFQGASDMMSKPWRGLIII